MTNAPFDGVDKPVEPEVAIDWWRNPDYIDLAKTVAKYLAAGILILFLYFRVLRPMMRPMLRKIDDISVVPPKADKPSEEEEAEAERIAAERAALLEPDAGQQQQQKDGYRENLAMAKQLAKDDPRVVANVVKAWVGANE